MPQPNIITDLILDPTQRTVEPRVGQIGYVRMFAVPGSLNEQARTMKFLCSNGTVDRYGEIVDPKAFLPWLDTFKQNPVFMAGHVYVGPGGEATSIGHWLDDLAVTDNGLEGTAHFLEDDPSGLADSYWQRYRSGAQKAVSVGWITHGYEMRNMDIAGNGVRQLVRVFTEVELVEISAVAIPANREALVRAASAPGPGSKEGGATNKQTFDQASLEAMVDRILSRKLDASPGGHLCTLIQDVVSAMHGHAGYSDEFDDINDDEDTPDHQSASQGNPDSELKTMLRQTLETVPA